VTEGLEGAGVPAGRIDSAMVLGASGLLLVAGLLGGWLAPLAQHAADRRTAWERSGGVPAWTQRGWTWIRSDGVLARVSIEGDRVRVTRAFEFGPRGPVDVPVERAAARPGGIPAAAAVRLLATPPALLTLPELLEAAKVRDEYGHPAAPVRAEAALRVVLIGLTLPATVTGLACRRMRRAGRRWAFVAGFVFVAMLGLQASHVWATRGELPVWMVVVLPLAAGSLVAVLAWRWAGSYSHSQ
jgi:lipopolysaccharide export LptBFGC system permease protein LptF